LSAFFGTLGSIEFAFWWVDFQLGRFLFETFSRIVASDLFEGIWIICKLSHRNELILPKGLPFGDFELDRFLFETLNRIRACDQFQGIWSRLFAFVFPRSSKNDAN
jgi:hypothetical protein